MMLVISPCLGVLAVLALLSSAASADVPGPDAFMKDVDGLVAQRMQQRQIPGVAIGIVQQGQVLAAKGYGYANLEHHVPVGADTIFQSGSVGKQFTAVALMLLAEDGKLALDDSLAKYFPDAPASWRQIRIRHLLTHTSGIPEYTEEIDLRRDFTEDELAKAAYALPLEFEPGSRWAYSNTGYILVGILLHKVSGQFYGDLLKQRVFSPLGMKTARVIAEEEIVPHRAAGYRLVNGELKNQQWVSPSLNTTADGSLYLSVLDYIAWDRGLRKGALLSPKGWAQVFTPVKLNSGKSYPYGFGWFIETAAGEPQHRHGGSWQGFNTHISRYLADNLTIIVLANRAGAGAEPLLDEIAAVIDPRLAKPKLHPIPDTEPKIAERLRTLLATARAGELSSEHLPYARRGFFPEGVKRYQEMLSRLGPLRALQLLERRELGDDRVSTYAAIYENGTLEIRFAVAPDGRVASLELESE